MAASAGSLAGSTVRSGEVNILPRPPSTRRNDPSVPPPLSASAVATTDVQFVLKSPQGVGKQTMSTLATKLRRGRSPNTGSPKKATSSPKKAASSPTRRNQMCDALLAQQIQHFRSLIDDPSFWSLRTLYPPPTAGSASQCVLQNEMLTRFGGLMPECADLLYVIITKQCALRPSCCSLYLKECDATGASPNPLILNQLSTTPGRYSMHEFTASGQPLGISGAKLIAPVLAVNIGLASISLRSCNLSEGSALEILVEAMRKIVALESVDLSCNRLKDEHGETILRLISQHSALRHIGLGKNQISADVREQIRMALAAVQGHLEDQHSHLYNTETTDEDALQGTMTLGSTFPPLFQESQQASTRRNISPRSSFHSPRAPGEASASGSFQARRDNTRLGGTSTSSRRGRSPPPLQSLTLVGVDRIDVSVPAIPSIAFFSAVNMYISLMARQLGQLEMAVFARKLPHAFEVYRKRCGSTNAEYVTILQFLEATFPSISRRRMLHTLKAYSQFSLVAPVRRPTKETLRLDQRNEIADVFRVLDKDEDGVLPLDVLDPPNATDEERAATETMLHRLGITVLNTDALAVLMAPYIVEARKRKRFR